MRVIDLFSKYAWVVPLKDKRGIPVTYAFQKTISKGCKLNKIWTEKGSEFKNYLFKRLLRTTKIEIYSAYYFFNEMINIEDFVSNLLKIDKSYKNLFIYYTEYVTTRKIDDYESI